MIANKRYKVLFLVVGTPKWQEAAILPTKLPEIELLADVTTHFLPSITASAKQIEQWRTVNHYLADKYDEFDGFVIMQEPDSLIYGAVASATAWLKNRKPIIYTTAPWQDGDFVFDDNLFSLGWRANIINALQMVAKQVPLVMILYGQKVMEATLARKVNLSQLNAFVSRNNKYIAHLDWGLELSNNIPIIAQGKKIANQWSNEFLVIYLHPGFNWNNFSHAWKKARAVIIKSNRQTGLTETDRKQLAKYFNDKPVIIYNRLGFMIENSLPTNFVLVDNMTWEETIVRTSWALAQTDNISKFIKLLTRS